MKKILFFGMFIFLNISIGKAQSTNWNENKLKEHWKTTGADEIEGIYVRSRKIVNCNGFGNCKTDNFVSGEEFFILKQNNSFVLSSFGDKIYGTMKKVYGANKYFLSTNLKYLTGEYQDKTFSMYLTNSNELLMEDFVNEQGYARATVSDTYSLVYKP